MLPPTKSVLADATGGADHQMTAPTKTSTMIAIAMSQRRIRIESATLPRAAFTEQRLRATQTAMRHVTCLLVLITAGIGPVACNRASLTKNGRTVAMVSEPPKACAEVGKVVGQGGGTLRDPYHSHSALKKHARGDARKKAAELGATHVLLEEAQVGSDEGATRTFIVNGTAYRCKRAVAAEIPELVEPEEPEANDAPRFRGPGTFQ